MKVVRALAAALLLTLPATAAELNCHGPSNLEDFRYSWRMRGGLSIVAGLIFPTSGVGQLKTQFPTGDNKNINSELLITSQDRTSGFYVYESEMDATADKTLMSYHGYAWKNKTRKERTIFDYVKRLAHLHKETPQKQWDKTEPLPAESIRDILTAIYYMRQNATNIRGPMTTTIYSDGNSYPVLMRPIGRKMFEIESQHVPALGFEIVDAPHSGGKKWPGGVRVWLSEDARRIPFEIEIQQTMASLQLELQSVESCAFMQSAATNAR
jgi:uncharacterized protein DUF3108